MTYKLNENEIKYFAESLNFSFENAKEITDIFYMGYEKNSYIVCTALNNVEDYIAEYDRSWYRFDTWEQLVISEIEMGVYGLSEEQIKNELGISIFQLSSGMYVQSMN